MGTLETGRTMTWHDSWRERWLTVLGRVRVVEDADGAEALLRQLAQTKAPTVLGFTNAHAMNLLAGDGDLYKALADADILLRDGSGMAMLYRWRVMSPGLNMNGTDFIPKLLAAYRGRRVALWGSREPTLGAAAAHCVKIFGIEAVSLRHGFDPAESYLALADELRPDLIVLGMGMPKQELLATAIRARGIPALVVCGGAILDFLGGKVSRAPLCMRRWGCEWLFRLFQEPQRLFKRYVVGNPAFLVRSMLLGRAAPSGEKYVELPTDKRRPK